MSVPSLGLIAAISERKSTMPAGMPTTIATSAERRAAGVDHASTPRGVRPIGLEDAEVARPLAGHQQQRGQQVHEADGDQQRARAEDDRADVGALLAHLVADQLGRDGVAGAPLDVARDRGAVGAGREAGDHVAVADRRRGGQRGAAEDHDLAVVVGLDVAADEPDA